MTSAPLVAGDGADLAVRLEDAGDGQRLGLAAEAQEALLFARVLGHDA